MTNNPQTEYTAEIAERAVEVRWPDNERGGATPPDETWQDRAWEEPTLHEIDEGSISGCSVLRWRRDPRSDAELIAASLALVTGKPAPAAARVVSAAPTQTDEARRERYAVAIHDAMESDLSLVDQEPAVQALFARAAEAAVALADTELATVLRHAATLAERLPVADRYRHHSKLWDAWDDGRDAIVRLLRRLAAEAQQQEPTLAAHHAAVPAGAVCKCPGDCGHQSGAEARQQPDTETVRAYPDCERCGDTAIDPDGGPCEECQQHDAPAVVAEQPAAGDGGEEGGA